MTWKLEDFLPNVILNWMQARRQKKSPPRPSGLPPPPRPIVHAGKLTDDERAIAYVLTIDPSIQGQEGSIPMFKAACALVLGFDFSPDRSFPILCQYNDEKTSPPWSVGEMWHKLHDADAKPGARGYLLNASRPRPDDEDLSCFAGRKVRIFTPDRIWHFDEKGKFVRGEHRPKPPPPPLDLAAIADPGPFESQAPGEWVNPAEPPPAQSCPNAICRLGIDPDDGQAILVWPPCKNWSCTYCHGKRVEHCSATVRHHLDELARENGDGPPPLVYLYNCPREQWDTVLHHVDYHDGNFFRLDNTRIDANPGYSLLVVSTVKPVSLAAMELTPEAARDKFCTAIEGIPLSAKGKIFSSSRPWKLLGGDDDRKKKYVYVGPIEHGEETCAEVLTKWGKDFEYRSGSARWWQWHGIVFKVEPEDLPNIVTDLELGEKWSHLKVRLVHRKPAQEVDEFAPTQRPVIPPEPVFDVPF